ncbi:hypothetical protein AUJ13_04955 [Candidatus Micrarchaeota archaeon CG1_02_49_24]|nr:MAG: hypothetical protein AUJ13_04955 [Candidatus Micrarchaeota archaeon CG1_02_49_24]
MELTKIAFISLIFALILASGCAISLWEPNLPANQTQQPTQANTGQPTSLYITSEPSSANVYINRGFRGVTPLTIPSIAPGTVELWVTTGTQENMTNITIAANQITSIHVPLVGIQPMNQQTQAPPATPGTGGLELNSTPTDAFVYIDGVYMGRTPLTIRGLIPGGHELKVSSSNYLEFKTTVLIEADKTQAFSPTLDLKGTFSTLKIDTNPSNADVWLNGSFQGMTPLQKIYPGNNKFRVQLQKPGYVTYTTNRSTTEGQTTDMYYSFIPTNGKAVFILKSTPEGADIYVSEDSTLGTVQPQQTPAMLFLTPPREGHVGVNEYTITLKKEGYQNCVAYLYAYSNTQRTVYLKLTSINEPLIPANYINSCVAGYDTGIVE